MARIHGRNGRVYLQAASTGLASPMPFLAEWSISFSTAKADVTSFGDGNAIYVTGLPDASGSFKGFYDNATAQTYTAAVDGIARNFYLYPDATGTPGQYFMGQILPDITIDATVADAVKMSASWNAASLITKVG